MAWTLCNRQWFEIRNMPWGPSAFLYSEHNRFQDMTLHFNTSSFFGQVTCQVLHFTIIYLINFLLLDLLYHLPVTHVIKKKNIAIQTYFAISPPSTWYVTISRQGSHVLFASVMRATGYASLSMPPELTCLGPRLNLDYECHACLISLNLCLDPLLKSYFTDFYA